MKTRLTVVGLFIIFLILRLVALYNVNVFEDHDSIQYLTMIRDLTEGDFDSFFSYNPDKTFVFPTLGGLAYLFTQSVETSARLVSLFSNILLFFLFYLICRKLVNQKIAIVALFFFTLHPLLINHSIGIITEPLYMSTIYLGIYIFLLFLEKPNVKYVLYMSIVFAFGFLNRTEGITYIVFIPLMIIFLKIIKYKIDLSWNKIVKYSLLYVVIFSAIISPQIIRVSNQLGEFALNGRQVWQLILHEDDGRPYNEKIRGLDYSPSEVNLTYLMKHPEERAKFNISSSISNYVHNIIIQLRDFLTHKIFVLFGKLEVLILLFGFILLLQKKYRFTLIMVIPFLGMVLLPPLLHNVAVRHILILIPFLIMIISIGIFGISEIGSKVLEKFKIKHLESYEVILILIGIMYFKYPHIKEKILTPSINNEYNKTELIQAAEAMNMDKENNSKINIASTKTYFPFFANGKYFPLPFTTYDKLVTYCDLNKIDYLFLDYRNMNEYLLLNNFSNSEPDEFELIYSNDADYDDQYKLYRFESSK